MNRLLIILGVAGALGIGVAAVLKWSQAADESVIDSTAHFMLNEMGRDLVEDVARAVRPALRRTTMLADDAALIAAMNRGDHDAVTAVLNEHIQKSTEIDVISAFNEARMVATTTVYRDGTPVPDERVQAVLARRYEQRDIITSCLTSNSYTEALEFQTSCDITPAYFGSTGLSVAYTLPVTSIESGRWLVSSRMRFERLSELIADRTVGGQPGTVFWVGDDGRYFDEAINGKKKPPPVPTAHLARLLEPIHDGSRDRVFSYITELNTYATLFPISTFETLEDGGLHLLLLAPHDWLEQEVRAAAQLRVAIGSIAALSLIFAALCAWHWLRTRQSNIELAAARRAAETANAAKSAFLANVSHELRTPMTAILGYADLLQHAPGDTSNHDTDENIAVIRRNGRHLLALINDVLDLSKIEADCMNPEQRPVAHVDVLHDVAKSLAPAANARDVTLRVQVTAGVPERIESDPLRLRQILFNLISNALKFTPAGKVDVTVTHDPERHQLHYVIRDSGIGLTPEQCVRIFEPFSQADNSTTRRFGGAGLGLCISRRLARLLGGDITVQSEPGVGSTFTATIGTGALESTASAARDWIVEPHALPTHHPPSTQAATAAPLQSLHVMLAEDGLDNQRLIKHLLTRAGATVTVCNDGAEVLAWFDDHEPRQAPHIILMDMLMPNVDGYSATRELRDRGHAMPIVALTANAMKGDRERCLAAGCDEYVSKPIDREHLITLCEGYAAAVTGAETSRPAV